MTIFTTTQPNQKPSCVKKSTSPKRAKGKDAAVPFDEMERLMSVYGSIKALRNRGAPKRKGSGEKEGSDKKVPVKRDSIKRKFYRWFPDFEERFSKDEDGHYQPVHGHEYEMKYRKEMRDKSVEDVSAKRSDAITKKKYGKKTATTESGNTLSRQVSSSSSSNQSDMKNIDADIEMEITGDIEINMPHIVMSSTTTTPSENIQSSFFFDSGNRAPSPLPLQQQFTEKAVSDEERDTIFSFVSESSEEDSSERLPFHWHARQTIFDEVDKEFYGEETHSRVEECFGGRSSSNDSVEGSLGVVSNSTSSGNSCHDLDEQWGSDSDIEDCLLLGIGEILPTRISLR